MAYAVLLDALAADVHTQMIGRSVAMAMGHECGEFVSWDVVRSAFDEQLIAPPAEGEQEDEPRLIMLRALGLR